MPFLLATCPAGAESVLRSLLPAIRSELRPAFARPGLLTFKSDVSVPPDALRPHPLVRAWGVSLGLAADDATLERIAASAPTGAVLQAFPGEAGPPGRVPPKVLARWADLARAEGERVAAVLGDRVRTGAAAPGDAVLDVIVRPDEPLVLAWHRHGPGRGPLPGGRWDLRPPPDAPSRAWAKLEELCAWSGADPRAGERVLEIGCAPGGATVALLDRGCEVVGVDPQPVTLPDRLADRPFRRIPHRIESVPRDDLPDEVHWIVVDAGVAAPVAIHALPGLVRRWRDSLRAVILTLKLPEWTLAGRTPDMLGKLTEIGLSRVDAAHLPSFRREVGAIGWVAPRGR